MSGKLVTTDLNLQGIRRVRNIATPLHELDGVRKIDLDSVRLQLEALISNTSSGVSVNQVRQEISSALSGVFRLLGTADASNFDWAAATGNSAGHSFSPGDTYRVTVAGQGFGLFDRGLSVSIGDLVAFTPNGWIVLEGNGDPTISQGDGLAVDFAGGIYSISLAPAVLQQLASLASSVAAAQADASVARQLAESHAAPLSALQAFQASTSQAVADLLATQQGQGTQLADQATVVQALEAFRVLTVTQLQAVSFKFLEGILTHVQGQAIATPPVPNAGFSPIPGLSGFEMAIESGADNGGSFLVVKHPKAGMPKFSVLVIDGDGNGDVIADQGHYLDDAIGVPTNEAWVAMPAYGSYAVVFV